jgi:hypothetical protein
MQSRHQALLSELTEASADVAAIGEARRSLLLKSAAGMLLDLLAALPVHVRDQGTSLYREIAEAWFGMAGLVELYTDDEFAATLQDISNTLWASRLILDHHHGRATLTEPVGALN